MFLCFYFVTSSLLTSADYFYTDENLYTNVSPWTLMTVWFNKSANNSMWILQRLPDKPFHGKEKSHHLINHFIIFNFYRSKVKIMLHISSQTLWKPFRYCWKKMSNHILLGNDIGSYQVKRGGLKSTLGKMVEDRTFS